MKTSAITLITASFVLLSCNKKEACDTEISPDDKNIYLQMQNDMNLAEDYNDSLQMCLDSALTNCNPNYYDSMFHAMVNDWEEEHNMYSANNPIDDHHHSMMNDENNHHQSECGDHDRENAMYHSIKDHEEMDSLMNIHNNIAH